MAHFAELDENNKVLRVLVVPDEQEHRGQEFLAEDLSLGGKWVQTSYNANFRKVYAGIGFIYNEDLDVFIPRKPFESWVFDENLWNWKAPVNYPNDDKKYDWDEIQKNWVEVQG